MNSLLFSLFSQGSFLEFDMQDRLYESIINKR